MACFVVLSEGQGLWGLKVPQDFISLHSISVTSVSLPLLCWNNSLPSVQLTHPHPSKLLRQSYILPSFFHCTVAFLEQIMPFCRGQDAFSMT